MEFLQLLMLFVAVMLIWFRPANEKLAWCLTIVAWFSVVFMYVGHVSTAILGNILRQSSISYVWINENSS